MALSHRNGQAVAGPQRAKLVPCKVSQWHGHHPENEECSLCGPAEQLGARFTAAAADYKGWWYVYDSGLTDPIIVDRNDRFIDAAVVKSPFDYTQLEFVRADGDTARRMCRCKITGVHRVFHHKVSGVAVRLCRNPKAIKDPTYEEIKF